MNYNNINDLGQFQFQQLIQINQDALSANFQLIHNLLSKLSKQQEEINIKQVQQLTINSQLNNQMSDLQLICKNIQADFCKETEFLINPSNQTSQYETLLNRFNVLESLYLNLPNQKEKKKYVTQEILEEKFKQLNQQINQSIAQSFNELKSQIQVNSNQIKQVECQSLQLSKDFLLHIDNWKNQQSDITIQIHQSQTALSSEYSNYFDQLQKFSSSENEKRQLQINQFQIQIQQLSQNQEKQLQVFRDLLNEKHLLKTMKNTPKKFNERDEDLISEIYYIEKQLEIIMQDKQQFEQQIQILQSNQQLFCQEDEVKQIISKEFNQFSSKFYEKLNDLQVQMKNNQLTQDQSDIETKITNQCTKFVDNLVKLMANKEETKKALIYLDEQIKYLEIKWDQLENQSLAAILKQQDKCVSCDKQIQKISGWGVFPPKLQISERSKNQQNRNDQYDRKKRGSTSRNEISLQSRSINFREQTSQRARESSSQEILPNLLIKQLMNNVVYQ